MFDGADIQSDDAIMPVPAARLAVAGELADARPIASGIAGNRVASGRYGEGRRVNLSAIVVTAALHAIALAGVLYIRADAPAEKREQRLTVVNLTPPPPPPSPDTPPQSRPAVVAPITPIMLVQKPTVATTPDPTPQPPTLLAAPAPALVAPAAVAAPAPPSVVQVSDLSVRLLSGAPPRYPTESRRKREQGTVLLALTLGLDGRVATISVARSSGFERLDQAALSAVRKWRWAPYVQDGKPAMVKGVFEIPFVLAD
ncbi:MAG: energy transducer TonB [Rhodocyclaceae bacterium]|nr:MAG: energy transducer TonB [Rhodocyclaceae bacterium]